MDIAERYVRLAHGINAHHDGFIDSYVGPPAWREPATGDLGGLEAECDRLEEGLAQLTDASRREFLGVQLRAMRTMIRFSRGDAMSYADEVRGLYDIEPLRIPTATFEEAARTLDAALPGSGPIVERWEAIRAAYRVPAERMPALLEAIGGELRARTKRLFALPEGESVEFALVQHKPWSGYNWYLGNAVSRVEINTDLPSFLHTLPDLVAHEAYPGHHTERVFKNRLEVERGYAEYSVQLLNAPESVLAEGIATNALEFISSPEDMPGWLASLAPLAGLSVTPEDARAFLALVEVNERLSGVGCTVAAMVHEDGASDAEALEYLQTYGLATPERARKRLEFIKHPSSRSYIFNYEVGYRLVRAALERGDRAATFERLLCEPVTPGQLRAGR